jgi:hypothetical protein
MAKSTSGSKTAPPNGPSKTRLPSGKKRGNLPPKAGK